VSHAAAKAQEAFLVDLPQDTPHNPGKRTEKAARDAPPWKSCVSSSGIRVSFFTPKGAFLGALTLGKRAADQLQEELRNVLERGYARLGHVFERTPGHLWKQGAFRLLHNRHTAAGTHHHQPRGSIVQHAGQNDPDHLRTICGGRRAEERNNGRCRFSRGPCTTRK
jgi:hypothetical protein